MTKKPRDQNPATDPEDRIRELHQRVDELNGG